MSPLNRHVLLARTNTLISPYFSPTLLLANSYDSPSFRPIDMDKLYSLIENIPICLD
jgi:hypothetical protein